jgi:hypothetical protein
VAWVVDDLRAIEALPQGVVYTPLRRFRLLDPNRCKVVRIKKSMLTPRELDRAVNLAASYVGRRYDYWLLVKLAWAWMWKRRHAVPQEGSKHRFICSELVSEPLWQVARFRFRQGVCSENTAPSDIDRSPHVETVQP